MGVRAIRLPDVGEGVAEAEVVEWHVKIGDLVQEDATIAAVMTDKATVEIPSPIAGRIVWLAAGVGDVVAVGADLVRVDVGGEEDGSVASDANAGKPDVSAGTGGSLPRQGTLDTGGTAPPNPPAEHGAAGSAASFGTSAHRPASGSTASFSPPAGQLAAGSSAPFGAPPDRPAAGSATSFGRLADAPAEDAAERSAAELVKGTAEDPPKRPAGTERPAVAHGSAAAVADQPARPVPFRRPAVGAPRPEGEKPLAAPAVRLRAREAGIDLRQVAGTGPAGHITHEDLDAFFAHGQAPAHALGPQPRTAVEAIRIVGLRRRIAEKMTIANARIPHITYVEEIDVNALEDLRSLLNNNKKHEQPRLTLLPFLMRAIVRAVTEQPNLNALFDDEAGVLHQHAGVHIGIAAQTATGLVVPVVRHAEALDLWASAVELNRLGEAAKKGTASRDELSGSTITITSLGAMGGIVTTPIINHPEVAIIGVNKIMVRPVWDGAAFMPRKMMNLSSSFDHRVVDGFDAARFIQRIKTLLETPALIFMEG